MEPIKLQAHDGNWKAAFAQEKDRIHDAIGQYVTHIHHVGSTAIPDLLAKPIIDIAIEAIAYPPSAAIIDRLATIGYESRGESGIPGRHWFTKGHPRQFNLHFCANNSPIIQHQIRLRDQLLAHEHLRREYERIKQNSLHGQDIDSTAYALAKSEFIQRVLGTG